MISDLSGGTRSCKFNAPQHFSGQQIPARQKVRQFAGPFSFTVAISLLAESDCAGIFCHVDLAFEAPFLGEVGNALLEVFSHLLLCILVQLAVLLHCFPHCTLVVVDLRGSVIAFDVDLAAENVGFEFSFGLLPVQEGS